MGIKQQEEEEECVFAQEDKTADPRKAGELWISSDQNISLSSDQHRKEVLQISTCFTADELISAELRCCADEQQAALQISDRQQFCRSRDIP